MSLPEYEYTCEKCGEIFINRNEFFFYDPKFKVTIAYPFLYSTASLGEDSEIKGNVNETYCPNCKKFIRIYTITRLKSNIKNASEIVKEGINNYINMEMNEIDKLKEIKKREKYIIKKKKEEFSHGKYHNPHYTVTFPELNDGFIYNGEYGLNKDKVINKALNRFHEKVNFFLDIKLKNYKKDIEANYIVLDTSNNKQNYYNSLNYINCPECHAKINKYINEKTPCPKCGGKLSLTNIIHPF